MIGVVLFHVQGDVVQAVRGLAAVPAQVVMDVAQEHVNKCVRMTVHMVVKIRVPAVVSIPAVALVQTAVNGNFFLIRKNNDEAFHLL